MTSLSLPLPPAHESRTEVFLIPWTLDCTIFFFCCSRTLGVKVVALANRRKSIAWCLQEFFRCSPKSVQYVQLLTVRPHLYMNAAAPLYKAASGSRHRQGGPSIRPCRSTYARRCSASGCSGLYASCRRDAATRKARARMRSAHEREGLPRHDVTVWPGSSRMRVGPGPQGCVRARAAQYAEPVHAAQHEPARDRFLSTRSCCSSSDSTSPSSMRPVSASRRANMRANSSVGFGRPRRRRDAGNQNKAWRRRPGSLALSARSWRAGKPHPTSRQDLIRASLQRSSLPLPDTRTTFGCVVYPPPICKVTLNPTTRALI